MTTHALPVQHNRPTYDGLHPFVYRGIIGLTIWLVLSIWAFFSRGGYIGLTLAMITFFFLIIVAIPVVIWKSWQHNGPPDETREPVESLRVAGVATFRDLDRRTQRPRGGDANSAADCRGVDRDDDFRSRILFRRAARRLLVGRATLRPDAHC